MKTARYGLSERRESTTSSNCAPRSSVGALLSDTDRHRVIVHLYEERGPGLLEHLRGMSPSPSGMSPAAALVGPRSVGGEAHFLRSFAPDRSLLFRVGAENRCWWTRRSAEHQRRRGGPIFEPPLYPAPATIFSEIKKLPAGHYLTCTGGASRSTNTGTCRFPPEGEEDRLDEESFAPSCVRPSHPAPE